MEFYMKLSAKQKMLSALTKSEGYNTFTTEQAQRRFGITNVSARISELRQEGYAIYANKKVVDGEKKTFYRLGTPSKSFKAQCRANGVRPYSA
jgi:biotin operon repressor